LCRGNSIEELLAQLERARAILRERTILVERANGSTLSVRGADFSYGVGKDIHEAESALRSDKAERESRGEIAREELRGITIKKDEPENSHLKSSTFERSTSPTIGKPLHQNLKIQLARCYERNRIFPKRTASTGCVQQ
jgi:hypothetical protein